MKIYVRERTRGEEGGARRPRFVVVAVEGGDLKVQAKHLRKMEIERIAKDTGAEVVYFERDTHREGHGQRKEHIKET